MTVAAPGSERPEHLTTGADWRFADLVAADLHRYALGAGPVALVRALVTERTFRLTFTYRLCRLVEPRLRGPKRPLFVVFRLLHALTSSLAAVDLPYHAVIGPGLRIFHGRGLVISDVTVLGADVTLFGGVTIGRRDQIDDDGTRHELGGPVVCDRTWFGPNAIVVGPVQVGEGARVAGGAVVFKDVPARTIVAGNPATVIKRDAPLDVFHPSQDLP